MSTGLEKLEVGVHRTMLGTLAKSLCRECLIHGAELVVRSTHKDPCIHHTIDAYTGAQLFVIAYTHQFSEVVQQSRFFAGVRDREKATQDHHHHHHNGAGADDDSASSSSSLDHQTETPFFSHSQERMELSEAPLHGDLLAQQIGAHSIVVGGNATKVDLSEILDLIEKETSEAQLLDGELKSRKKAKTGVAAVPVKVDKKGIPLKVDREDPLARQHALMVKEALAKGLEIDPGQEDPVLAHLHKVQQRVRRFLMWSMLGQSACAKLVEVEQALLERQDEIGAKNKMGVRLIVPMFSVSWVHEAKELLALRMRGIHVTTHIPALVDRTRVAQLLLHTRLAARADPRSLRKLREQTSDPRVQIDAAQQKAGKNARHVARTGEAVSDKTGVQDKSSELELEADAVKRRAAETAELDKEKAEALRGRADEEMETVGELATDNVLINNAHIGDVQAKDQAEKIGKDLAVGCSF